MAPFYYVYVLLTHVSNKHLQRI